MFRLVNHINKVGLLKNYNIPTNIISTSTLNNSNNIILSNLINSNNSFIVVNNYATTNKADNKKKTINSKTGSNETKRSKYIGSKKGRLYGGTQSLSSTHGFRTLTNEEKEILKIKQKKRQELIEKRNIIFEKKDNNVVIEKFDDGTVSIKNKSKYVDGMSPSISGRGVAFSRLGIYGYLVEILKNSFKVTIPSLIQQLAIPEILKNNKDILFVSQTGTGKTLTYLLPIIQEIKKTEQEELKELKEKYPQLNQLQQDQPLNQQENENQVSEEKEIDQLDEDDKDEENQLDEEQDQDEDETEEQDQDKDNQNELDNDANQKEIYETKLLKKRLPRRPKAIIIVPTRELGLQVMGVAKKIAHKAKFSCTVVSSGGGELNKYVKTFKKKPIDVLIATPGMLQMLIERQMIYFSKLQHLVIDEADSMFSIGKGFDQDINKIIEPFKYRLQHKNEQGVTPVNAVICSATLTDQLMSTINSIFPSIEKLATPTIHRSLNTLSQKFIQVKEKGGDKHSALLRALNEAKQLQPPPRKTLIFCNTPNCVRSTEYFLTNNHFKATSLHGEMPPHRRTTNWKLFTKEDSTYPYLVSTDIASRGIDIQNIDHVILFDFPSNPIDYLHRIGRTARAGNSGLVTSLITKKDKVLSDSIKESIRKGTSLEKLSKNKKLNKLKFNYRE